MKRFRYWVFRITLFLVAWSFIQVILFRFVPVYFTPLMGIRCIQQLLDGEAVRCRHTWVAGDELPKSLKKAVVASEDNLFYTHNGFDFDQIEIALEEASEGKRSRGASTISQQTAKNVFLWNGGGFVRKGLEAYYTVLIELFWSKQRIMEVYLNSIEMGDGIYGAHAVAKEHFSTKAAKLSEGQSALIAASLPNPLKYNSSKPTSYLYKRQAKILSLMNKIYFPNHE